MSTDELSILDSVKKSLGLDPDLKVFDPDIVMHINSVFTTLYQLGVGQPNFTIEDSEAIWKDFYIEGRSLQAIQSYVYIRVRLLFDPPPNARGIEALENYAKELEWRLNVLVEEEGLVT